MITFIGTKVQYDVLGSGTDMPHMNREVLAEIEKYFLDSDNDYEVYYIPYRPVYDPTTFDPRIHSRHRGATFFSEDKKLLTFIKLKWG